jgi:2,3-bisphosphoglycerate-independent phosphoglycerate mutase
MSAKTSAKTPYVLLILDGWGHREDTEDNAIALAKTPNWDSLWQNQPHCLISGSGLDVGLPAGQMGNSEVGHMNLGAGRVVDQDFTRITKAIDDGSFYTNSTLAGLAANLKQTGKSLHIFGLLSPGGVHSHEHHIHAAVDLAFNAGVSKVYVHAFLDGRDVPPRSAKDSLARLQKHIQTKGEGGIASIIGRYFAMDRDNRWDRVEAAYKLITTGESAYQFEDPVMALEAAYARDESDEFVQATAIQTNGTSTKMAEGDAVLFMNFRSDRAREISRAFTEVDFKGFKRATQPALSAYVTLTEYATNIDAQVAYAPANMKNSIGEYVANQQLTQLRIAETEKYAHVTFFFSGGQETPFIGEDRTLIPSPTVATYDLQPEMSAPELTDKLCAAIESRRYDLIVCNYANGDMVGHTGDLQAAMKAVECVDQCLARILSSLEPTGGHCLITADHGNVEQMSDHQTGQAHTAHTCELVPLIYVGSKAPNLQQQGGTLSDVSPTLLDLMSLAQPAEMTGKSLCQWQTQQATNS